MPMACEWGEWAQRLLRYRHRYNELRNHIVDFLVTRANSEPSFISPKEPA